MGTVDSIVQYVQDHLQDGPVAIKEAAEAGKIILGMYCTYMPWELIHAAGAIGAGLCAKSSKPIPAAEEHLPRNLCPLIKASYGHALQDSCPYFHFCHAVLAETTCDGKKKMYELLNRIKPVYTLQIPQRSDRPEDLKQLKEEFYKIREYLEELVGRRITQEDLRQAITLRNAERRALRSLWELSREEDPPLSGMELEHFSEYMQFSFDKETAVPWLEEQVRRIRQAWERGERPQGSGRPRILVTGCPLGGIPKVIEAIENAGGTVVCYENCGGQKEMGFLVDETKDPMEALAEKYLATGCSIMSPNRHRIESLDFLMEHYRVDGVVEVLLTACHTYAVEAHTVRERVQAREKKYILVETDYSESDREQLATRMDAFIEML